MNGSEKQVAWATRIKSRFERQLDELCKPGEMNRAFIQRGYRPNDIKALGIVDFASFEAFAAQVKDTALAGVGDVNEAGWWIKADTDLSPYQLWVAALDKHAPVKAA